MRGAVLVLILGNAASALSVAAILLERFVPAYTEGRLTRLGWAIVIGYATVVALCGAAAIYFGLQVRRRHAGPEGERPRKYAEIGIGVAVATLLMAMWPFGWLVHRKLQAPVPERWELDVATAERFWRAMPAGPKRWEFTRALAIEGHAEGFAALLEAARSPDVRIRYEAALQLYIVADQGKPYPDPAGAAEAIVALISDPGLRSSDWAGEAAGRAVQRGWIAHELISGPVFEALQATRPKPEETGDISPAVGEHRLRLVRALAWMGPGGGIQGKLEALRSDPDTDDPLRQRCAELLDGLNAPAEDPFREEQPAGRR